MRPERPAAPAPALDTLFQNSPPPCLRASVRNNLPAHNPASLNRASQFALLLRRLFRSRREASAPPTLGGALRLASLRWSRSDQRFSRAGLRLRTTEGGIGASRFFLSLRRFFLFLSLRRFFLFLSLRRFFLFLSLRRFFIYPAL